MESKYIIVKGIVQGVGFRPFVYKLAVENNLKGNVKNTQSGVYINIEGKTEYIKNFLWNIRNNAPSLSKVEEIITENREIRNYKNFKILNSNNEDLGITLISPDIAICKDCENDINNINEKRRYKYPFTNCTNCGPRFSIIKDLPYDRNKTSMECFNMCNKCSEEYNNPLNRRFHAQPTCCEDCGPNIKLLDKDGYEVTFNNRHTNKNFILDKTKQLLKEGKIIAIKGIGGFHLACDGKNYEAIENLRKRKNRKAKPLALMVKDIYTANKYCYINKKEREILLGSKKPIILLNKKDDSLPINISYKNNTLGIMLPYTPLHILLFDNELDILVMTSGNISQLPMIYKNEDAINSLKNIADYYLLHNRDIHTPVDDSVVKVVMDEERVIRNGRGYAPYTFKKETPDMLSLGSETKNTFSISKSDYIFMSPYIGNMKYLETQKYYKYMIESFENMYSITPKTIIHDEHPNFWHKDYLDEFKCEKIGVYHHHAHIASCMFENNIEEKVIGLAFDGTGYGSDKKIWGSEFLICDYKDFKRVGHLKYMKMPGNDKAVIEPWKMALSLMYEMDEFENIWKNFLNNNNHYVGDGVYKQSKNIFNYIKNKNYNMVFAMLENNINCSLTSSMGRLFDGVSSILGFDHKIGYEGEACIELENLARESINTKGSYSYKLNYTDEKFIIDINNLIEEILIDIKNNIPSSAISMKFHNTIIEFSTTICKKLRNLYNINKVALSGGVFQNDVIFVNLYNSLKADNFEVLTHKLLPCNDSSISIGQMIIGSNRRG